ncbi:hypothetical protein CR513_43697, partial [Mucuna pruriens]
MLRFTSNLNLSFFLLLFCLFLSLFSASSTFSHRPPSDALQIVGDEVVRVPWETRRSTVEAARAKNTILVLAKERTRRKDLFNGFQLYTAGWNITNVHYLTVSQPHSYLHHALLPQIVLATVQSVLSTALAFFAVAVAWFIIFGVFLLIYCACCCCCNGGEPSSYSKLLHHLSMIFLILCTIAAIGGCAVMYTGQGKFRGSISNTLDYVVSQAQFVAENLTNVTSYFDTAEQLVKGIPLPLDLGTDIEVVKMKINTAADSLSKKAKHNSKMIHRVIDGVWGTGSYYCCCCYALCFISRILYSFLYLGGSVPHTLPVCLMSFNLFIFICEINIMKTSVAGDTCVAMDEWVVNPTAHTALDDILPCVEKATILETIVRSKTVTYMVIEAFDHLITNVTNGIDAHYNQSGPLVPLLCNPFNSDFTPRQCAPGEVTFQNAEEVWKNYTCHVSSSKQCTSEGRLTPTVYTKMVDAVKVGYGLLHYGPFFAELVDCTFVRKTFANISSNYCPRLRKYSEWIYLGSAVVSAAVMFSLILWIVFVRQRLHTIASYSALQRRSK